MATAHILEVTVDSDTGEQKTLFFSNFQAKYAAAERLEKAGYRAYTERHLSRKIHKSAETAVEEILS